MSAYAILMQEINDRDRYLDEYVPRVQPFLKKHGGEMLVGGFGAKPAEGEPPNSTVVIRFPDAEAAWGFLNDPDYQPVRKIRLSVTSRGWAVVAPEFTPAGNGGPESRRAPAGAVAPVLVARILIDEPTNRVADFLPRHSRPSIAAGRFEASTRKLSSSRPHCSRHRTHGRPQPPVPR